MIPSGWNTPLDKRKGKLAVIDIVLSGVLGALTFAAKYVMSPLPNIEPVSLMVMLFAVVLGRKWVYPVYLYVLLEILTYGISLWNVYYLYVWAVLAIVAYLFRRFQHPLFWAAVSGGFGLLFGALCGITDIFIGGIEYAVAKWISGISFDLLHCGGNFVIALVLFVPLRKLLTKLYRKMRQ